MPAQTTSLSALSTADSALSIPLLLQPEVGGLVDPLGVNRPNQSSRSLLFVDGGVADYQTLVAGASSGTEVHLLDSSQDAVTQITNTLLGRSGISSLHIVSHGEAGGLDFGTGKLNLSNLPEYAAQLQGWGKALTDGADILLYGCNVAQGELGKAFTSILGQLTGADVAASDDLTGNASKSGDWTLEVNTGKIESVSPFSFQTTQAYNEVLAINVAIVSDVSSGDTTGFIATVNQLNDDTYFDFNATLVSSSQVDSLAELNAYDTVIIGNNGNNVVMNATFASALRSWVEAGGGLVSTGWIIYGSLGNTDIDAVVPVNTAGYQYLTNTTVVPNGNFHPITTGVSSFASAYTEAPSGGIDPGATTLATVSSSPVVVVGNKGLGKSVYLGPDYSGSSNYPNPGLRSGDADRLLEQAVNWVAATQSAFNNLPSSVTFTENNAALTLAPSLAANMSPSVAAYSTDGASIQFNSGFSVGDSLSVGGSGATNGSISGTSINWSYNTGTGALSFSGTDTIANYITALQQVTYIHTGEAPSTTPRQLTYTINRQNKYYEYVSTPLTWTQAQQAAGSRSFLGLKGYLATVTSAAENTTVDALTTDSGWIGASDAAVEGQWRWATGPEANTQFWQGGSAGSGGTTVGGQYANWVSVEPNNFGGVEHYAGLDNAGQWVDFSASSTSGYFVEYGGLSSDAAATGTLTINLTPVNDLPSVTLSSAAVAYTENQLAVIIDPSATVSDVDSADFNMGRLTVNFQAGGTAADRLAIRNEGAGGGQIGVSGSNVVTFGGTTIGTFTGGVGTTPLVVTFNSNSSPAAAQALLRNLTYSNASDAPSTVDRTVSLVLTDGDGGTSAIANKTITVVAVNDAPTVTAPATIAVAEDITTTLSGISFVDPDAGSGIVTATLTVGAGTLRATTGGGVTVGGTATDRTLSGILAAINSFITGNNLTYITDPNATASQTLSVSINDNGSTGGGALSSAVTNVALNVTAVNDAPTVTAPAAITVIEDTVSLLTGIAFADVDADSSTVTATFTVGAGTLAATSGGGVTVGGTATSRTLSGTITAINSFIAANSLTYIPVPDSVATQTLSVSINDNGNTGTGGSLPSGTTNISLNITAVNDAPSFTKGSDQTITAGAGVQTISNWATGFNPGPADEVSQTVQAYVVTVDNTAIFAVPPTIDNAGNLIYTPATNLATATTATISVSVRDSGGTTNEGTDTSVVQTFTITVKPQPTISIAAVSQSEDTTPGPTPPYIFTVSLNDTSTQEVRVNYATADRTATLADNDYTAASGTLIFAAGETSKTFTVNVNPDDKYENTEAFLVNLSDAINGVIGAGSNSVSGTIVNDDSIPVANITPTLTQAEGNSGATAYGFTVTLSNSSFEAININYTTQDGTATVADGDYTAATGTLSFAPGEYSKTITVNATGDTKFEPDETFQLSLTGAATISGAVNLGSTSTASGTITNDDSQPTISIGNVSQTEGNSGTSAYSFTVSLSNASTQTVAVNYTTADGTATVADSDYVAVTGTLSFAPGETSKTITVLVNGDTKFEADQSFSVALSNASNGTLASNGGSLGNNIGTGTIVNDDTRPTISINSVSQTEGNIGTTPYAFTASLSHASDETVTINYATANGTATLADNDYTATSGTLTFAPGTTSQTITVLGKGDSLIEANETFLVNLTAPTSGTIATGTGTGTINNDDAANLLWRNGTTGTAPTGTGENAIWQLNNFTLQSGYYIPTLADLNWQIISTADFDRDGNADLLWRNRSTGENAIWQMNSTGLQSGYYLATIADLNWRLLGTDDFNGDGTADLLWRNRATGENAIWQMSGFSTQTAALITTVADVNWQIVSTADFDNDGKADLLWRNQVTGENAIWQMNGLATKSTFYINAAADTNWQVAGTADFDNDGIADIVWRNRATGENAIWQMNSTGLQSGYFVTAAPDVNWQLVGVADLGGDRTPDFLWRNATMGQTGLWQLSGFSYVQAYQLPNTSSEWNVRPFTIA
ncbi:DUF4347 domain-containing protein [Phormidium sp. FACHB-592]|uniref:DUF4347 domain-containing protein n=1 Tax=Stenomitos frigidus AS-A4 TaxID=2933935 RepID=A0ABV0KP02_9CYAN|nr:DUF4347 domain-containing protein [Phormidium sp. FACHB-592]MBD2072959.1 DUF4347 domain-containing protein [Phormidium sp. FACHB-592]